jgi:cytochrome c553
MGFIRFVAAFGVVVSVCTAVPAKAERPAVAEACAGCHAADGIASAGPDRREMLAEWRANMKGGALLARVLKDMPRSGQPKRVHDVETDSLIAQHFPGRD